jgi:hypothetical protein
MKRGRRKYVLAVVVAVALACAGYAAAFELGTIFLRSGHCVTISKRRVCAAKTPSRTVTVASTTITTTQVFNFTVTTPPPPPQVAFTDGTYRVGIDIQPGTYQASSPTSCYWARLRGFSGGLGDVIANANYVAIVTIEPGDVGFESTRCGNWSKIG